MTDSEVYQNLADLNLWMKITGGDSLTLNDIPDLLPLRWNEFRDNWSYIRRNIKIPANFTGNVDLLNSQINDFTDFIETQKTIKGNINPFSNKSIFYKYYSVFGVIPIDIIPLSIKEKTIVDDRMSRIRRFVKNDFLKIKEALRVSRDQKADLVDTGDIDYNAVYRRAAIEPQTKVTIADILLMQTLQDSINVLNFILANITSINTISIDPFALAKANANNPEIDIRSYASGKLVRFNYGEDLKSIANRFLDNPDKWIDIAIANGLKPPYVDEVGSKIPLISNGSKNQISIAKIDTLDQPNKDKLYINQIILLSSATEVIPDQRRIIDIKEIAISGEIIIDLEGDTNLERFHTADNAYMRVFKPNTINSSFYILIPSEDPIDPELYKEVPWFLQTTSADLRRAKVDLSLSDEGDIIFTSASDIQLQYGLDNAIQALRLKFAVELGELVRHPDFGLLSVVGLTNANVWQVKNTLIESINRQIENDPRFERVERLDVQYFQTQGSNIPAVGFNIFLVVRLAGSQTQIPITFAITAG